MLPHSRSYSAKLAADVLGAANAWRSALLSLALCCAALLPGQCASADVRAAGLFQSNAVLQRGIRVPVWGTAADGEKVTVTVQGARYTTVARKGQWSVSIAPLASGSPCTMTITGHNRLVFTNILVGDVYFCTGQSNMEWPLYLATDGEEACRSAGDSQLRFYTVPRTVSETPSRAVRGVWEACAPRTARQFSAVAYFFGRALRREERVPVGLILCSWSGAPAMAWTSRTALLGNPALAPLTAAPAPPDRPKPGEPRPVPPSAEHEAAAAVAPSRDSAAPLDRTTPAAVYNGMVAPVIPFAIRGIVCCAGEADTGQASLYQTLFSTMIGGWRDDWKQGEIPCLFVQLAPFMRRQPVQQESAWAELREAQRIVSRTTPGLGMAVVLDAGDESDIHPRNKNTVGERLALLARELIYKEPVQAMGPEYESMHVEGANAIVSFRGAGEGLDLRAGQGPTGFTIAGQDGRFVPAPVTVRGDRLVVSSPEVRTPIAVRYGWADNPPATLWNRAGLPASPFRTDTLPLGAR